MKILLINGPHHNKLIDIAPYSNLLLMPVPEDISWQPIEITEDTIAIDLKVAKYIRSGREGYWINDEVYPIWIYDGDA